MIRLLFLCLLILTAGKEGASGKGEGCCHKKKVTNTLDGLDGEYTLVEGQGRDSESDLQFTLCLHQVILFDNFILLGSFFQLGMEIQDSSVLKMFMVELL